MPIFFVFALMAVFVSYCPTVLGFWADLQGPWHSVHVWEAWRKTLRFCVIGLFSWAIAHSFGVPEWFTRSMTLSTSLTGIAKNSSFLRFRAVFVGYCPLFWGSMEIYKKYDSLYILGRNDENCHFCIYGRFCELLPTVLGFRGSTRPMTLSTCLRGMTKNSSFLRFRAVFMSYRPLFRGYVEIYKQHDSL
jgi:hypothetical protein